MTTVKQLSPKRQKRDPRFEFKKPEKIAMFKRAGGPEKLRCEGCQMPLMGKPFDYHHNPAIWTWTEEKRQRVIREGLTAEDGELLGHCCHAPETSRDTKARKHGERIVAKAAKATGKKSAFRTNRDSPYKVKLDGSVVWRETGEPVR